MARIYFSFQSRDRDTTVDLAEALEALGHESVLRVDRHIRLAYWRQRLIESLKSSDGVVVLLPENSLHSHYVISEIGIARAFDDRMFLVPVMIDNLRIPDFVQDLYVVSQRDQSIRQLATTIDEAIRDHDDFNRSVKKNRIFIGHGRSGLWRELKDFIHERLKLPWDEFNREPTAGETTVGRLQSMLDSAAMALLVLTAEDEQIGGTSRARQNVVHEVGLFQGRLGFRKAIVLMEEGCEAFSNIDGLTQVRFSKGKIGSCLEELRLIFEREGLL